MFPLILDLNVLDRRILSRDRAPSVQRAGGTNVGKRIFAHGSGIVFPVMHRVLGSGGTAVNVVLDTGNGSRDWDGRGRGWERVGDGGGRSGRSVADGNAGLVNGNGVIVGHDEGFFGSVGKRV
jgi:hypothetical protein